MVKVKEAVQRAQTYLPELFQTNSAEDLRLEAVELSDDSRFWSVTFSYRQPDGMLGRIDRDYKTIKLRSEDGEFIGARNEPAAWSLR
jgi:hypothetical protein